MKKEKELKDFNNEGEARKYFGEKPFEKESWEKKFNKIWGSRLINTPLAKETKSFIHRLLKEKDNIIADLEEEIEKLERREP